jgi:hypothetical protein
VVAVTVAVVSAAEAVVAVTVATVVMTASVANPAIEHMKGTLPSRESVFLCIFVLL